MVAVSGKLQDKPNDNMKLQWPDKTAIGLFTFFSGLCVGLATAANGISVLEATSITIAITAVYGLFKWKSEFRYREKKEDRKRLINLVKKNEALVRKTDIELRWIISVIEKPTKNLDSSINVLRNCLSSIYNCIENCENNRLELESEIPVNVLTTWNDDLAGTCFDLIEETNNFLLIAIAYHRHFKPELLELRNETTDVSEIRKRLSGGYNKYFQVQIKVSEKLGVIKSLDLNQESKLRNPQQQ